MAERGMERQRQLKQKAMQIQQEKSYKVERVESIDRVNRKSEEFVIKKRVGRSVRSLQPNS